MALSDECEVAAWSAFQCHIENRLAEIDAKLDRLLVNQHGSGRHSATSYPNPREPIKRSSENETGVFDDENEPLSSQETPMSISSDDDAPGKLTVNFAPAFMNAPGLSSHELSAAFSDCSVDSQDFDDFRRADLHARSRLGRPSTQSSLAELDEISNMENKLRKLFLRLSPEGEALNAERVYSILIMVLGESATPDFTEVSKAIRHLAQAAAGDIGILSADSQIKTERISKRPSRPSSVSSAAGGVSSQVTGSWHFGSDLHTVVGKTVNLLTRRGSSELESEVGPRVMDYSTFKYLMAGDALQLREHEFITTFRCIRDALIKHGADVLIAKYARLRLPTANMKKKPHLLQVLDPLSGIVILLNALVIGLSTDIHWNGWDNLELAFTCFFTGEIVLKTYLCGWRDQIWGPEWAWNWFDTALVAMAIADVVMQHAIRSGSLNLRALTLARLIRLARITKLMRLLRLLRLKIFKELLLMVRGVFTGLRTLFWAIVLLVFLIYVCAIFLRHTVGDSEMVVTHDDVQVVLFDSLLWSMFNLFRCFMSDGTLIDGTSLVGHLEAEYGAIFVVPYALCTLFIVFGIFNLIAAIFVENVIESAKSKRNLADDQDQLRVALVLRNLLLSFAAYKDYSPGGSHRQSVGSMQSVSSSFSFAKPMSTLQSAVRRTTTSGRALITSSSRRLLGTTSQPEDRFLLTEAQDVYEVDGKITRSMFEQGIKDPVIMALLDDLEIQLNDRAELFDVLDADGNNIIEFSEMVAGIMKLRSVGADKADAVTTNLYLRALQQALKDVVAEQKRRHNELSALLHTMLLAGRSPDKCSQLSNIDHRDGNQKFTEKVTYTAKLEGTTQCNNSGDMSNGMAPQASPRAALQIFSGA